MMKGKKKERSKYLSITEAEKRRLERKIKKLENEGKDTTSARFSLGYCRKYSTNKFSNRMKSLCITKKKAT